jgi:hypothetical protein
MITVEDFRTAFKSLLRRRFSADLARSGIVLRECPLHEKDGKRWIGLPSKPQIDSERRHRKHANGKGLRTTVVEISGEVERELFQEAPLAAVVRLLGKGSAP